MAPAKFIELYSDYFGENAPLPLAVIYTTAPMGEMRQTPGCMFKQFHRAFHGEVLTFSANNLMCGGGKLYTGLGPTPPKVYDFVSLCEKYKESPANAKSSIDQIGAKLSDKPFINFIRIDKLESFDEIEGVIFFVSPDIMSGLFTWANYDSTDLNAVVCPWGSGCSTAITSMVNENRRCGKHCFIGMFDVSARPYFRSNIMSFSIPRSRFIEMCQTLPQCSVSGSAAWLKVRKRINTDR